jgi:hypothetical protein
MTDLLKQIDDLVASKTFNLDALESIKAIKDGLERSESLRKETQKRYEEVCAVNEKKAEEIARLSDANRKLSDTIDLLKGGEAKAREAVWEKQIAEAKASAYQDALYTVFKPSAVRETIQRSVVRPVEGNPGGNGNYPTPGYLANGAESETITKEQL